jgi:hypothetical protein
MVYNGAMSSRPPPLPVVHDLVRAMRSTHEETVEALLAIFLGTPPPWSYGISRALSGSAYGHEAPLPALLHTVAVKARTRGRGPNAEVVGLIWDIGKGERVQCHPPHQGRTVSFRHDLAVRGVSNFYYVENRLPTVVFVQPRRGFNPDDWQLGVLGALMRRTLLHGDFADATIEMLDFSTQSTGTRVPRQLNLRDLPVISDAELARAMQRVADAYDTIIAMEIDWDGLRRQRHDRDAAWKEAQRERRNRDQDDFGI